MKVTLTSTSMIVTLSGVEARVWEGHTDSGIKMHAFITRVAIDRNDDRAAAQFNAELLEQRPPSPEVSEAYSLRMIL